MTTKLEELAINWHNLKRLESKAKEERLEIENAIILENGTLPEKGTTKICNSLSVSTGLQVKYDQKALMELYESGKIKQFPFEKTFKPINADIKYLEKNEPEMFALIEECAETSAKKPAFKAVK